MIVDRLDLIDELVHPVRSRLVQRLGTPKTVAELAQSMNVPVTRLYHHVNRLEDKELVVVDATRQVAAVTERRYRTVARAFRLSREYLLSLDPVDVARALGAMFDMAKSGFIGHLETLGVAPIDPSTGALEDASALDMEIVQLTPARRQEFVERLVALTKEFRDDQEGEHHTLFFSVFPDLR
jgi:DNA-binding transcriptional ArsR family regulator